MIASRIAAVGVAVLALISAAHAGPCSDDIAAVRNQIDARLQAQAAAGPTARESVGATMRRQPTPESIAAAEQKLPELPADTVSTVRDGMARARAADAAGDKTACEEALASVRGALGR